MGAPVLAAVIPATGLMWATYERLGLIPVIGWRVPNIGQPEPVLPVSGPTLFAGAAIVAPDGTTVDLTSGVSFETVEIWRAYVHDDPPYQLGDRPGAPKPGKHPKLHFDGKPYAKASFWKVVLDGYTTVFTIPAGEPSPTDKFVSKITRDEYFAARKVVPEVEPDVFKNPGPDPDQLDLPFEEPEGDPDEDDDDDLI